MGSFSQRLKIQRANRDFSADVETREQILVKLMLQQHNSDQVGSLSQLKNTRQAKYDWLTVFRHLFLKFLISLVCVQTETIYRQVVQGHIVSVCTLV